MLKPILLSYLLLLPACGAAERITLPPVARVEIRSDGQRHRPLDWAVFRIQNVSEDALYQEMCNVAIEGRDTSAGPWSTAHGSGRGCLPGEYVPPRLIAPGETVLDSLQISADAYDGEWRLKLVVYEADGEALNAGEIDSFPFRIES